MPRPPLSFTDMVSADLDEVLTLESRAFADPWTRAQFEAELNNRHATILLARHATTDRILGYIAYWFIIDEIQILDVAVDPDAQRQGIARTLLQHVLDTGEDRGCITWSLEVRASNAAARALYEKAGFHSVNVRRGYYAHGGEDAIVMVRGVVPGT